MGNSQSLNHDDDEDKVIPIQLDEIKETKKSLIEGITLISNDLEVDYSTLDDGSHVKRRRTETENVIVKRKNVVHEIMAK